MSNDSLQDRLSLPPVTWEAFALALGVVGAAWLLALAVGLLVGLTMRRRGRGTSAATVFGGLSRALVVVLGLAAALTVLFPSVKPVDLLGGLGVISIAAGIAFQTVLGNLFAGIMILAEDRFREGDQIAVQDVRGTVAQIRLGSTAVRTFDGRLVLIPNSVIHSEILTVQTGYEQVRSSVPIEVDDQGDLARAAQVAVGAMSRLPGVADEPVPQALYTDLGTATASLELRFWSGARQLETREARHAVIVAVVKALRDADVATGSDIHVVEAGPRLLDALEGPTADDAHHVRQQGAATSPDGREGPEQQPVCRWPLVRRGCGIRPVTARRRAPTTRRRPSQARPVAWHGRPM